QPLKQKGLVHQRIAHVSGCPIVARERASHQQCLEVWINRRGRSWPRPLRNTSRRFSRKRSQILKRIRGKLGGPSKRDQLLLAEKHLIRPCVIGNIASYRQRPHRVVNYEIIEICGWAGACLEVSGKSLAWRCGVGKIVTWLGGCVVTPTDDPVYLVSALCIRIKNLVR